MRASLIPLFLLTTSCGTLIGNIKPVEEKAENYVVADLAEQDPQAWTRLTDPAFGDQAYESTQTGVAISVLSACRENAENRDLRQMSKELARGMTEIKMKRERPLTVSDQPALGQTVVGTMTVGPEAEPKGPVVLQSVVLQKDQCSYQLLSVSEPESFASAQEVFSRFVDSFAFVA